MILNAPVSNNGVPPSPRDRDAESFKQELRGLVSKRSSDFHMLVAQYYRKASDIENRRAYAKAVEHASSNIEQSLDRPLDDFDF